MTLFQAVPDLRFGRIVEVSGTSLRVELAGDVAELTRSYEGRVYTIGQIGSLVKVHVGRTLVFGYVTLLRMRSEEVLEDQAPITPDADQRVMDIELFGEGQWNSSTERLAFSRGVGTYPLPRQGVYLLTADEATCLYQAAEGEREDSDGHLVPFGSYAGATTTPCRANIDKMFALHCAVLGSTGSGKSGAVAALLHSLLEHRNNDDNHLRPRVIIIDPHGEYGAAFGDRAALYRAYDPVFGNADEVDHIRLPYWLMSGEEFRQLIIGKTEYEATSQHNIVYKALTHARMVHAGLVHPAPTEYGWMPPDDGLDADEPRMVDDADPELFHGFDRDKPRMFSLKEFENHIRFLQATRKDKAGHLAPLTANDFAKSFASILDKLAVLRRDPRVRFLMEERNPDAELSLSQVLAQFIGDRTTETCASQDIRVIDISGLPNEVAGPLTASISRLLFQYKLHQSQTEKEHDPVLLVCEEAHRYVPNQGEAQYAAAQASVRRIAREGRKYGLGLMLVSQRPADIESTVISQCGTWLVLRLTNGADQQHVARFLPDTMAGMTRALPALGKREALFVGEGASLPARVRIRKLDPQQRPQSHEVSFLKGWSNAPHSDEDLRRIAERMNGS